MAGLSKTEWTSGLLQAAQRDSSRLVLRVITKRYPAVVANSDVSLTVQPGEIHAVLGENGAGKSTLMKIIYGSVKPDAGSIMVDGVPVSIRNRHEARALGITMVFQHFYSVVSIPVAQNVRLCRAKHPQLARAPPCASARP